jgi:hypothetical protein
MLLPTPSHSLAVGAHDDLLRRFRTGIPFLRYISFALPTPEMAIILVLAAREDQDVLTGDS